MHAYAQQGDLSAQHEVARNALGKIIKKSIKEDAEYGGLIYQDLDGSILATDARTDGRSHGVNVAEKLFDLPEGANILATYHTHGAFSPGYSNEQFSSYTNKQTGRLAGYIGYSINNKIHAYLGTPSKRLRFYNYGTGKTSNLGRLK